MQKPFYISVFLVVFVGFGTGIFLAHLEQGDVHAFKADVLVSTDAPVSPATPVSTDPPASPAAPVATPPAPNTAGTPTAPSSSPETVSAPLPVDAAANPPPVSTDTSTAAPLETSGTGLVLSGKTTSSSLAETPAAKDASESLSTEVASPDVVSVEVKAVDDTIDPTAVDVKTADTLKPSEVESSPVKPSEKPSAATSPAVKPDVVQPPPQPLPPVLPETSTRSEEARIAIEQAKKQPALNKKILDAIGALRSIPDLLAQLQVSSNDQSKRDDDSNEPTSSSLLEMITSVIKELTDNLQKNTVALEETLDYIYLQQGTAISHGRCISSSYFTYSNAEHACVMMSRKVCKASDIVPDNRYENLESCKQDNNLIYADESREITAFKKQKDQYLRRLSSLQQAYKYYSVRWEELVELVKDSQNFEALSAAGNAVNQYRTENKEPEKADLKQKAEQKIDAEKVEESVESSKTKNVKKVSKHSPATSAVSESVQDNIQLSSLPAASVQ